MIAATRILLGLGAPALIAAAGAALAHPHAGGDGKETVQKIIVLDGKHRAKGDGERVRQFHFRRGAGGGFECDGEQTRVDETTGGDRTRILICGDDKLSAADRAARLEETLAKIRSEDHLGAEHKAKVEAALSAAISRLREGR
jgi:hypothetical protein